MQLLAPRPHNLVGSGLEPSENKNEALKLWKAHSWMVESTVLPTFAKRAFLAGGGGAAKAQANRREREAERGKGTRHPPLLSEQRPSSVLGMFAWE